MPGNDGGGGFRFYRGKGSIDDMGERRKCTGGAPALYGGLPRGEDSSETRFPRGGRMMLGTG